MTCSRKDHALVRCRAGGAWPIVRRLAAYETREPADKKSGLLRPSAKRENEVDLLPRLQLTRGWAACQLEMRVSDLGARATTCCVSRADMHNGRGRKHFRFQPRSSRNLRSATATQSKAGPLKSQKNLPQTSTGSHVVSRNKGFAALKDFNLGSPRFPSSIQTVESRVCGPRNRARFDPDRARNDPDRARNDPPIREKRGRDRVAVGRKILAEKKKRLEARRVASLA